MPVADEILQGCPIPAFFRAHEDMGWKEDTVRRYDRCLHELLDYLDGREPDPENLEAWKRQAEDRYSPGGVNGYLAAANNYFLWCGRPDLYLRRTPGGEKEEGSRPPAVTREEYLELLRTARGRGRRRTYLLIKLFALTGVPLRCLGQVTVDLVREGQGVLSLPDRKEDGIPFYCPEGLREEILGYASRNGIYRGPVFISRRGNLLARPAICREMKEICQAAGVSRDKGNPGSLRRLWQETREDILARLDRLRREMYDQMLEREQEMIGWMPEEELPDISGKRKKPLGGTGFDREGTETSGPRGAAGNAPGPDGGKPETEETAAGSAGSPVRPEDSR